MPALAFDSALAFFASFPSVKSASRGKFLCLDVLQFAGSSLLQSEMIAVQTVERCTSKQSVHSCSDTHVSCLESLLHFDLAVLGGSSSL